MAPPASTVSFLALTVLITGATLVGMGLVFWRRGAYPRCIGTTPHCPRCDYSLGGLAAPTRCPECGANVSNGRFVRGERRRRPGLAMTGRLLILLGIVLTSAGITGMSTRIDWYRYRPTAWVIDDLLTPHDALRAFGELQRRAAAGKLSATDRDAWEARLLQALAGSPPPSVARQFWTELQDRSEKKLLSHAHRILWIERQTKDLDRPSTPGPFYAWQELRRLLEAGDLTTSHFDDMIERSLAAQLVPRERTSQAMIEWLGELFEAGKLSDERQAKFINNLASLSLAVRPRVRPNDPVPYEVRKTGRGPDRWWLDLHFVSVYADDTPARPNTASATGLSDSPVGLPGSIIAPPAPGRHRLRAILDIELGPVTPFATGPITNFTARNSRKRGPSIRHWQPEVTADFQVLDDVPIADAPADAATLRNAFRPGQFTLNPERDNQFYGDLNYDGPPVNIAFDVLASVNGREYRLGAVRKPKGRDFCTTSFGSIDLPDHDIRAVDIILRSSDQEARNTLDLYEIWKGQIVYPGVPVTQLPAAQSAAGH